MIASNMIPRRRHVSRLRELLGRYPVVAIIGARQTGKTTLVRLLEAELSGSMTCYDLENPEDRAIPCPRSDAEARSAVFGSERVAQDHALDLVGGGGQFFAGHAIRS